MNKTIFNLFAALAFIFATLAATTPSAYAVGAAAWFSTSPDSTGIPNEADGIALTYVSTNQPDNEAAINAALALCEAGRTAAGGNLTPCTIATDGGGANGEMIIFSADNPAESCFNQAGSFPPILSYAVGPSTDDAFMSANAICLTVATRDANDGARDPMAFPNDCAIQSLRHDHDNDISTANIDVMDGVGLCDETGVICPVDQFKNSSSNCVACPTATHNIINVNGTDTCLSMCESEDEIRSTTTGDCVEILTCEGRTIDGNADGVPNVANGLCMACPDNTLDLGVSCGGCFPGFVENAASEDGCRAAANSDDCQTIDDTMPIYANGDCVSATSDSDCANAGFSVSLPMAALDDSAALTGGCVAAVVPEFRYQIGEMTVIASEDTPLSVNVSVAAALSINIAASVDNTLSYSSDSEGQLMVSPAGIVGFVSGVTISVGVHRIEIIAAEDNTPIMTIGMYLMVAAAAAEPNEEEAVSVVSSASSSNKNKTGIIVGLLMLGVYIANTDATAASAIRWTPSYALSGNNGNVSYSVGSRWTATTDDWRYYWQTATSDGGEFVYGSGMNWNNGIFAANIDSETDAELTDVDMSISAAKTAGMWQLNGGYHLNMQISDTETDAENRLNISAGYYLDRWLLSANANTDGDTAAAKVNYSYRF